jgi:hypothetical protein
VVDLQRHGALPRAHGAEAESERRHVSVRPYPPSVMGGADGSVANGSNDGSTTAGPLIPPIGGASSSLPSDPVHEVPTSKRSVAVSNAPDHLTS